MLVVGAGKMGRTAAKRLRAEGARRVIVTNRTISRAHELVAEIGFGEAVEMPETHGIAVRRRHRRSPRPALRTSC